MLYVLQPQVFDSLGEFYLAFGEVFSETSSSVLSVLRIISWNLIKLFFSFTAMKERSGGLDKDYIVGEILGTGGFGTVYAGYRRRDHLPVSTHFLQI